MELSIKQIIIGRFLLGPNSPTTYVLSPRMWQWASDHGYAVDPLTSTVARNPDWDQCRNLENNLVTIIRNKDEFQMLLLEMIRDCPHDLDRYTTRFTVTEYAILLQQGGQEVYDWFVTIDLERPQGEKHLEAISVESGKGCQGSARIML
jgi:hypothetical protein